VFYRDRAIADFRHAVVIDGCEVEPYERLEAGRQRSCSSQNRPA